MRLKLASALIAALLVFGMVFGVGQAAAASLPGGPLYGLKLTAEEARMGLTSAPEAKAELAAQLAENRLDEISRMMAAGKTVDGETAHKAQQQLMHAHSYAYQIQGEQQQLQAQHRLGKLVQNRHRVMALEVNGVPQTEQQPLRALLGSMERVRAELHTGEGEPPGEQIRHRPGEEEPEPLEVQDPADQPGAGHQAGQDDGLLDATGGTGQGGQGQGSMGTGGQGQSAGQGQGQGAPPDEQPAGPNPDGGTGYGPGPQATGTPEGAPYTGESPSYGPGAGEPQQDSGNPQSRIKWPWDLLLKEPKSGGKN